MYRVSVFHPASLPLLAQIARANLLVRCTGEERSRGHALGDWKRRRVRLAGPYAYVGDSALFRVHLPLLFHPAFALLN